MSRHAIPRHRDWLLESGSSPLDDPPAGRVAGPEAMEAVAAGGPATTTRKELDGAE